jgi:light-regulated signal transduction histidine kinase (bacteriophytochrome)
MSGLYATDYDQSNCDREPIHIIRAVQPFAVLLAFDRDSLRLVHYSENAPSVLGISTDPAELSLADSLSAGNWERLQRGRQQGDYAEVNPIEVAEFNGQPLAAPLYLIAHENKGLLVLEFEERAAATQRAGFFYRMDRLIQQVQRATSLPYLFRTVVREIRALTGFDRVMLYRFDAEYNGEVIAEDKREDFEPYLHLRYPASDIPRQARDLYLENQVRLVADVAAEPVLIQPPRHPDTDQPLDLTYSVARAVSPVHLRYLRNMSVRATMSIAILVDNRLWGLIACHHATPLRIDYRQRQFLRFVGTVISGHLSLQAVNEYRSTVLEGNITRRRLREQMQREEDILSGLTQQRPNLLDLNEATGAALYLDDDLRCLGDTPPAPALQALRDWLDEQDFSVLFATDSLPKVYPPAAAFASVAAGLLAVRLSSEASNYLLWFKPEIERTVHWGGNPTKAYERMPDGSQRLSPRSSFARWTERVRLTSAPWTQPEQDFAVALYNDIRDVLLRQYEQVRSLNQELEVSNQDLESFNYSVSHDLRAPLRSIEGFTQILQEEYGDQLDEYGRSLLSTIIGSARKMNDLIAALMTLSRLGHQQVAARRTDIAPIIAELTAELVPPPPAGEVPVRVQYAEPLYLWIDPPLARSLLQNLLSNAVKYTRDCPERTIRIQVTDAADHQVLSVRDTGVGFEPQYAERIFEVFTRLVSEADYEGSGVGLATVKRLVERHGGRVWAESTPHVGTTVYCQFPKPGSVA